MQAARLTHDELVTTLVDVFAFPSIDLLLKFIHLVQGSLFLSSPLKPQCDEVPGNKNISKTVNSVTLFLQQIKTISVIVFFSSILCSSKLNLKNTFNQDTQSKGYISI